MPRRQSQKAEEVVEPQADSFLVLIYKWILSWASNKNFERFLMLAIPISCIEIYNRRLYKRLNCCSRGKKRVHAPVNVKKERLEFFNKHKSKE